MTAAELTREPAPPQQVDLAGPPRVVVACPIRSREWAVPKLHEALARQTYPVVDHLLFIEGDSTDGTRAAIEKLMLGQIEMPLVRLHRMDTGSPFWSRDREGERYTGDQHTSLATVYNTCIEQALLRFPKATHIWLNDSDVIPDPDVLALLLAADKDVVAPMVMNSPGAYNFMLGGAAGLSEPYRLGNEARWLRFWNKPFPTTFVSACVLYRREVLKAHLDIGPIFFDGLSYRGTGFFYPGPRFAPHPRSHDFPMQAALKAAGYQAWVEPRARCSHWYGGPDQEPLRP